MFKHGRFINVLRLNVSLNYLLITACNCDASGSRNLVCNYDTGQCTCEASVALQGVPNVLGLTDDLQCRSCQVGFFGHYTGNGCQPCNCDALGSNNTQCNDFGICDCKDTITGDKCARCQSGYYAFTAQGCTACNCSVAGSTSPDCQAQSGICSCKTNVLGGKCDACAANSFNLAETNPDGCQQCFCFGHGTQCTEAPGFTTFTIHDETLVGWTGTTPLKPAEATHCQAPAEYLGNRLSSYGTTLTVYVQSRGGASVVYNGQKPIILTGMANSELKSVYFKAENFTADSGISKPLDAPLFESNWYINETHNIDYFNFYAILADLRKIEVQRKFGAEYIDMSNFTMHSTQPAGQFDEPVTSVEQCTCTPARNVGGLSCEDCAQGFKRIQANSTSYETCIACNCNGKAETTPPMCDQISGECLNCRNGTNGTQCESCSAFVQGAACDTCVANYWGLASDGCRACDCDALGSSTQTCDQISGQCTCRLKVVGRKCDECEDNYYQLSVTGCIECNDCYGLVMIEVNDLRTMRDNLTLLVTGLEQDNNNTLLGPFKQRLDSTVSSMQRLLEYLTEAKRVEGTVGAEIERLNNTLNFLRFQLDINTELAIQQSNESLANVSANIAEGQVLINQTITNVMDANAIMTGQIYNASCGPRLDELLVALKFVEDYLTTISTGALKDVFNVGAAVVEIESGSAEARTKAMNTLQNAQANNQVHQQTTTRLNNLEEFMKALTKFAQETSDKAKYAQGNASSTLDDVIAAKNSATAMQPITTNAAAIQSQAAALKSQAEGIAANANNGAIANQTVVSLVRDTQQQTDDVTTRINALKTQSTLLQDRTLVGYAKAQNAAFLEEQTFTDAARMLEIMRDFGNRSAAIERDANASLATVQTLRISAEKAINDSDSLQTSLLQAEENARVATALANETKGIETVNNAELQSVNTRAQELFSFSSSVLNTIQAQSNNVISKNATLVTGAKTTLDSNAAQVASLQTKAADATTQANNASTRTGETQTRINQILQTFQNVDNIDQARIAELRNLVIQQRADFDARLLKPAVERLKAAMDEQRQWLNGAKLKRTDYSDQILRLRNVKDQLVNTPP